MPVFEGDGAYPFMRHVGLSPYMVPQFFYFNSNGYSLSLTFPV